MSFTVAEVLADVRELIQDSNSPTRYSDAFIIRKINQTVRRCVIMRPDLFVYTTTMQCLAGSLQTAPTDSARFMDVLANQDGDTVKEVSQDVLDTMYPTWGNLTGAAATNWMRYPRDPNKFYVYPPATAGAVIQIAYARTPAMLISTDVIPMQDVYYPVVVDGTVWLMESVDAEHVESGRAKMFQDSFKELLTAGLTARRIVDNATGGEPKDEVIV